jgi:hypothetical protein
MRFSEQALFKFDPEEFSGVSIDDLLGNTDPGDMDGFKLGGLSDFKEAFAIVREFYENYPLISIRELRTNTGDNPVEVDDLWHEPAALKLEFNRLLRLRAKISLGEESAKHEKTGIAKTYEMTLYTGISILYDLDYWPRIGDEFTWRGILHSVSHVKVDPRNYFQNSSLPLHICMTSIIRQSDGSIPHYQNLSSSTSLEETNRPTLKQPESSVDDNAMVIDDGF